MGFFKKLFGGLKQMFTKSELTNDFYDELLDNLVLADCGINASEEIVAMLSKQAKKQGIKTCEDCQGLLKEIIIEKLSPAEEKESYPLVLMCVGVNGVGKTTAIGRLANFFKKQGKEVVLAAADTFRAAATEQLTEWADRNKVRIIKQGEGADSASVVFDAISSCKAKQTDVLIVDTAGRLHNNVNLMAELEKIGRIVRTKYTEADFKTYIVIDATTGQNGLNQAETFNKFVPLDGVILTKTDGTAKGGIVLNIKEKLNLDVKYVGFGEGLNDLDKFDVEKFVDELF